MHELNVVLPREIEKAVDQGDLRENSEYKAALDRQQFVRARLDYLSRRLSELSELDRDAIPDDRVGYGSRVKVEDLEDGTTETFTLAYGDLIDVEEDEISMESPIGKALLGATEGDEVRVSVPVGTLHYRVVELTTIHDIAAGDGRS